MKGLLSIIKMNAKKFDEETQNCLNMMETSADRLTNLIAKILDVEAIESQQLNLAPERTSLSEILQGLVERFVLPAKQKSIRLQAQIAGEIYAEVDPVYVTQVIENLVSNALKFSPPGKKIYIRLFTGTAKGIFARPV